MRPRGPTSRPQIPQTVLLPALLSQSRTPHTPFTSLRAGPLSASQLLPQPCPPVLVSQHLADTPCPWQRAPGLTLPGQRRQPPPAPGVVCSTASPLTSAYARPWGLWPGPCPLPAPSTITITFPSQLQAALSGLSEHRRLPPRGHYAKPFRGCSGTTGSSPIPPQPGWIPGLLPHLPHPTLPRGPHRPFFTLIALHQVSAFWPLDRFSLSPPPSVRVSDPLAPPGGHTGNTRDLHAPGARRCAGCPSCTRSRNPQDDPREKYYHSRVTEVETGSEKLLSFSAPPASSRAPVGGREFEQAPGVGDGQGGLACCSPWGCKESDMTEPPD